MSPQGRHDKPYGESDEPLPNIADICRPMQLIIEAGSTKTDSVTLSPDGAVSEVIQTLGINPINASNFAHNLTHLLQQWVNRDIRQVCYYGAGCINTTVNSKIGKVIKSQFPLADITIKDDLTALGHSFCQRNVGLICILGTGSIIGYYDGQQIVDKWQSGGYLLGDEGSGYRIGQQLYLNLLRGQLNVEDESLVLDALNAPKEKLIELLYQNDNPRFYLASLAPLVNKINATMRSSIVNEVFGEMTQKMILPMFVKYDVPLHICGSIGFHFQDAIAQYLKKFNIIVASFNRSPLKGLIEYHRNE